MLLNSQPQENIEYCAGGGRKSARGQFQACQKRINSKDQFKYQIISPEKSDDKKFDQIPEYEIFPEAQPVDFIVDTPAGRTYLQAVFMEEGAIYGVYYTYIQQADDIQLLTRKELEVRSISI